MTRFPDSRYGIMESIAELTNFKSERCFSLKGVGTAMIKTSDFIGFVDAVKFPEFKPLTKISLSPGSM
jgi:hypothetical protein